MKELGFVWRPLLIVAIIVATIHGLIALCFGGIPDTSKYDLLYYSANDDMSPYLNFLASIIEAVWNKMPESISRLWDIIALPIIFLIAGFANAATEAKSEMEIEYKKLKDPLYKEPEEKSQVMGYFVGATVFALILLVIVLNEKTFVDDFILSVAESIAFSVMLFIAGIGLRLNWNISWAFFAALGIAICAFAMSGVISGYVLGGVLTIVALIPSGIIFLFAGLLLGSLLKLLRL